MLQNSKHSGLWKDFSEYIQTHGHGIVLCIRPSNNCSKSHVLSLGNKELLNLTLDKKFVFIKLKWGISEEGGE